MVRGAQAGGLSLPCFRDAVGRYARATGLVFAELVWPTRCVLCEAYGTLLCAECMSSLPFLDQWLACPRCGAPYGLRQCSECNGYSLGRMGLDSLPFDSCVSSVLFGEGASRIVRAYKDKGERRLSLIIAYLMACAVPPGWLGEAGVLTYVPATAKAKRKRGFDHCEGLCSDLSRLLGVPCASLLEPGRAADQRLLGRLGRFANASNRFSVPGGCAGMDVILADDVLTTGATLMAASQALKREGARSVRCVSFARVY